MTLGLCAGLIAPYYNLVLATIVVYLFIKLFQIKKPKGYILPWKYLFVAFSLFIIETIMTILSALGKISFPHIIFPIFEMSIIYLFIYSLLLQREKLK